MAFTRKITKAKFEAIKILLESKATVREICKYLDLSDATIYAVKNSESFEQYEQFIAEKVANCNAARALKMKQKKAQEQTKEEPKEQPKEQPVQVVEHRQSVTIQATHYMMTELQKTNELLTLISNKLAFIVDELTGVKS